MVTDRIICLGVGIAVGAAGLAFTQGGSTSAAAPAQTTKTQTVRDFPDLVGGLRATPGCLGVKTSAFENGKQVAIFAWFENKAALNRWYASSMHQDAMRKFFPKIQGNDVAAAGFKDDKAPILVVATVTPSDKPMEGQSLAVSQISVEMYTPVPGGLALGSSWAPESLNVPGLSRIKG